MTDRQHRATPASRTPATRTTHEPSLWVFDIRELGLTKRSGAGSSSPIDLKAPAPDATTNAVLTVEPESTVTVEGLLESVSEGVLASGTARGEAHGECARCLQDLVIPVEASFRELFAYPDSATAETTDEDEVPRLLDDTLDIEPLVHDELVLAMPTIPLCAPDCAGLCSECGVRLDDAEPGHGHEIIDPRWSALAGLLEATGDASSSGSSEDDRAVTVADDNEEK